MFFFSFERSVGMTLVLILSGPLVNLENEKKCAVAFEVAGLTG